jgi:hypothetical protein
MTMVPGHQRARELKSASEDELWSAFRKADQFRQMGDRGDVREERLTRFLGGKSEPNDSTPGSPPLHDLLSSRAFAMR